MVEFEIKRNMTPQNIAEITQLLDAVEKADNRKPLNDHLWIDLRQGGRPGFAGLTARHHRTGQPIAYCQISRGNESWAIDLVVDPQHRNQTLDLGNALFSEASKIISGEGGGHVHWWVFGATSEHRDLARQIDLHSGRTLLQMRVQLPLSQQLIAATKQVETQSFRIGIDEDVTLKINVFTKEEDSSKKLKETMDQGMAQALGFLGLMAAQEKELTPVLEFVKSMKTSSKAKMLSLEGKLPGKMIKDAILGSK